MTALTIGTAVRNAHTGTKGTVSGLWGDGYVTVRENGTGVTYGPMGSEHWIALEAEAAQLRVCAPVMTRTLRAYSGSGELTDVLPVTDEFAGSVLELWSEQGFAVIAGPGFSHGARFLAAAPDGWTFTLA